MLRKSNFTLGLHARRDNYRQPPVKYLDINIISAQNLPKKFHQKKKYAVVHAYGDIQEKTKKRPCSRRGEIAFNEQFVFKLNEVFLESETSMINVSIYVVRNRTLFKGDYLLGSTGIVISTFLNRSLRNMVLQIKEPKTLEPCGALNVAINVLPNTNQNPQISSNAPQSFSMRFDSKRKIDEVIGHAFLEQQHEVDQSGPLDEMWEQEQHQTEQENIMLKMGKWRHDLSSYDQLASNRMRRVNRRHKKKFNLLDYIKSCFQFCLCGGNFVCVAAAI